MSRRQFLHRALGLGGLAALPAWSGATPAGVARVVVVGGGYGGATAAKYLRLWSEHRIEVTLVEPDAAFVSCPLSNLVLGGSKTLADITLGYDALVTRHGVRLVRDRVAVLEPERRRVRLGSGDTLAYDRLVLSPGVDFLWDELPGMARPGAHDTVLHAWKAGAQTVALRAQLQAMPDGGVCAISIPRLPYRCPPGPYERACQVAHYFSRHKPNSKVLVLDANADVTSKGALFKQVWAERYPGIVEYRPRHAVLDVDAAARRVQLEFEPELQADVLNLIPPMRAGQIAVQSGLATHQGRWCEVDFLSFESRVAPGIHILGDAIQSAPGMPKSGHMANQQAKVCAAAIVAALTGQEINRQPLYNNACYSFVSDRDAMHVVSVHRYDAARRTMTAATLGLSPAPSELEGRQALAWAHHIWSDTLG